MEVIWVRRELEYFCEEDWTTQITLMGLTFFPRAARSLPRSSLFMENELSGINAMNGFVRGWLTRHRANCSGSVKEQGKPCVR